MVANINSYLLNYTFFFALYLIYFFNKINYLWQYLCVRVRVCVHLVRSSQRSAGRWSGPLGSSSRRKRSSTRPSSSRRSRPWRWPKYHQGHHRGPQPVRGKKKAAGPSPWSPKNPIFICKYFPQQHKCLHTDYFPEKAAPFHCTNLKYVRVMILWCWFMILDADVWQFSFLFYRRQILQKDIPFCIHL